MIKFKVGDFVYYKKRNEYFGDMGRVTWVYNNDNKCKVKWISPCKHKPNSEYTYTDEYISKTNPNSEKYELVFPFDLLTLVQKNACATELAVYLEEFGYSHINEYSFDKFIDVAKQHPTWIPWLIENKLIRKLKQKVYKTGDVVRVYLGHSVIDFIVSRVPKKHREITLVSLCEGNLYSSRTVEGDQNLSITKQQLYILIDSNRFEYLGTIKDVIYEIA